MKRDTLLSSLVAVADDGYVGFADGGYVDFSISDGEGRIFEVCEGCDTVRLTLTRSDMLRLHAALTRVLLEQ